MSEFFVGQSVVCINDAIWHVQPIKEIGDFVQKGQVYTIRHLATEMFIDGTKLGVKLDGLTRTLGGDKWLPLVDAPFSATRFRPLEYKAMSIFRAIAANPNIKIREKA